MNNTTTIVPLMYKSHAMIHTSYLPKLGLKLSEVQYPDRMLEIGKFRIHGWKNEEGINQIFFSRDYWIDPLDQRSYHWIITDNDTIVASARLSLHTSLDEVPYANLLRPEHRVHFENKMIGSINRLVVDPAYRGLGLSKLLDEVRIERARAQKAEVIIAFPQLVRLVPMTRKGFKLIEQLENIPEMPERPFYVMSLNLTP